MSTRLKDNVVSGVVSEFLDENYYLPMRNVLHREFERVNDIQRQLKGVDVVYRGKNIDEKVKFKGGFYNNILQYPSVELSFLNNRGQLTEGWFLRKDLITDIYDFITIFTNKELVDEYSLKKENIEKLVILRVSKKKLMEFFDRLGIDLKKEDETLRNSDNLKKYFDFKGIHLTKSPKFSECPINAVIRRDIMLSEEIGGKELIISRGTKTLIENNFCK